MEKVFKNFKQKRDIKNKVGVEVIQLEDKRELFEKKLKNYEERARQQRMKINEFEKTRNKVALKTEKEDYKDTLHKIFVVEKLLEQGMVSGASLFREAKRALGRRFDHALFENAFLIIQDYARTGGYYSSGGDGFPHPEDDAGPEEGPRVKEKSEEPGERTFDKKTSLWEIFDTLEAVGDVGNYSKRTAISMVYGVLNDRTGGSYTEATRTDGLRAAVGRLDFLMRMTNRNMDSEKNFSYVIDTVIEGCGKCGLGLFDDESGRYIPFRELKERVMTAFSTQDDRLVPDIGGLRMIVGFMIKGSSFEKEVSKVEKPEELMKFLRPLVGVRGNKDNEFYSGQEVCDLVQDFLIGRVKLEDIPKYMGLEKALENIEKKEEISLKMDRDGKIKHSLEMKLKKYQARMKQAEKEARSEYSAPDQKRRAESTIVDLKHKMAVVDELLSLETVNKFYLRGKLEADLGREFRGEDFTNAFYVTEDYVKTGGENVFGGEGFGNKEEEEQKAREESSEKGDEEKESYKGAEESARFNAIWLVSGFDKACEMIGIPVESGKPKPGYNTFHTAYRKWARKNHPDVAGKGVEDDFKFVSVVHGDVERVHNKNNNNK